MDQNLINAVFTLSGALMSWILKTVWDAIRDLNKDMKDLQSELNHNFVAKDDYNNAMNRIETMFGKIMDKLDQKVDKQ